MINWRSKKGKLSTQEKEKGAIKRQKIISDAEAMKRLAENPDFKIYCELLETEAEGLRNQYEDKYTYVSRTNEEKISLIARINQIKSDLRKPGHVIWMMENMTEVREAIKDKTRVRQAHGTKTGG